MASSDSENPHRPVGTWPNLQKHLLEHGWVNVGLSGLPASKRERRRIIDECKSRYDLEIEFVELYPKIPNVGRFALISNTNYKNKHRLSEEF